MSIDAVVHLAVVDVSGISNRRDFRIFFILIVKLEISISPGFKCSCGVGDCRQVERKCAGLTGLHVKHDDNFFFAEQTDLLGNEDNKFWVASKKAPKEMHAISLVFDFGGNPANTKVTIKDIIFQTHRD